MKHNEIKARLIELAKKEYKCADGYFAYKSKKGKWHWGSTNDEPMKFGDGTSHFLDEEMLVIMLENDLEKEKKYTKKSIEERKKEFAEELREFLEKYGKDMLNDFYKYWTEHNNKGRKMRFEMSKNQPFNIGRRLVTWKRKQDEGNKNKPKNQTAAQALRNKVEQSLSNGESGNELSKYGLE